MDNTEPKKSSKKYIIIAVAVVVVVLFIIILVVLTSKKYVAPPNLAENRIQYQGDCNNCGGLIWMNVGDKGWDKYYQVSCIDAEGNESERTRVFGPVTHHGFNNPKIRLQDNNINPCGQNRTKIYRGDNNKNLYPIMPRAFIHENAYDGMGDVFTDL